MFWRWQSFSELSSNTEIISKLKVAWLDKKTFRSLYLWKENKKTKKFYYWKVLFTFLLRWNWLEDFIKENIQKSIVWITMNSFWLCRSKSVTISKPFGTPNLCTTGFALCTTDKKNRSHWSLEYQDLRKLSLSDSLYLL